MKFHVEWLRGRWHVLAGKLDVALKHYGGQRIGYYRAGDQQKDIVEETLVLAAYLRKNIGKATQASSCGIRSVCGSSR